MQLQLTTAPTYFHFPPSGKRKAEDKYDITRLEFFLHTLCCVLTTMYYYQPC